LLLPLAISLAQKVFALDNLQGLHTRFGQLVTMSQAANCRPIIMRHASVFYFRFIKRQSRRFLYVAMRVLTHVPLMTTYREEHVFQMTALLLG